MMKRTLALLLTGSLLPLACQADDLYQLAWRGKVYVTAANGQVASHTVTEQYYVNKVATDNGLNPRDLVFVYRADKRDTAVVRRSDGGFVADVIQMEFNYTDVTNPPKTVTARQAFLYDEYHDPAIGSAAGIERLRRNANGGLVSYSFSGTFQYAYPDVNAVFIGRFATGSRINDTSGG